MENEIIPQIPQLVYLGLPVAFVILALVEFAKRVFLVPKRWLPAIALGLGCIAGLIAWYFVRDVMYLYLGLLTGLLSAGVFDFGKKTILNK